MALEEYFKEKWTGRWQMTIRQITKQICNRQAMDETAFDKFILPEVILEENVDW